MENKKLSKIDFEQIAKTLRAYEVNAATIDTTNFIKSEGKITDDKNFEPTR